MDMLQEVFECISKDLMQRTSFGQWFRETNTQVVYEITDTRKAKYLFARMDLDSTEVDPDMILERRMAPVQNSLERCEVLVSNEKPMELKFKKTKELFELKFHYGYWNASGVPQHWTNLTWQFIIYNTLINFLLLNIFLLILNWIEVRPRSNLGLHMSQSHLSWVLAILFGLAIHREERLKLSLGGWPLNEVWSLIWQENIIMLGPPKYVV